MNMNEALQQSLYDKLSREQDKYRDWLKGQPPEEILHHSYEYTVREDILMSMEELTLSEAETRALLLSLILAAVCIAFAERAVATGRGTLLDEQARCPVPFGGDG